MKMNREDLKDLIKECLIEILAEGVGGQLTEAARRQPKRRPQSRPRYRNMVRPEASPGGSGEGGLPTHALQAAVEESAGGNSVMADILADTAMTTLPSMLNAGHNPPPMPGSAESVVANAAPQEVFGENADRWAAVAFNDKPAAPSVFTPPPPPTTVRKLSDAELDAPVGGAKKTA